MENLQEEGIHVSPTKTATTTGKKMISVWTPELRAAVEMCKAARPVLSPWLFCTRSGDGYVKANDRAPGWKSMWQRFMDRVLAENKVTEAFSDHDIRAKAASDEDSATRAQQLLGHADLAITQRVYRRKPERITPTSRQF